MHQFGAHVPVIFHFRPPGVCAHEKTPVAVKRKGAFILTSLAVLFNVARNPVTNRHAFALAAPVLRVNTVTWV
jgi:hypothetical protein